MEGTPLDDEITALRAIYGDEVIRQDTTSSDQKNIFILDVPGDFPASIRLAFPDDYPESAPEVLGTQHVREGTRKGDASRIADLIRDILGEVWRQGEVCLYDLIEEASAILSNEEQSEPTDQYAKDLQDTKEDTKNDVENNPDLATPSGIEPPWIISDVVTEKRSVFIAHCAPVTSVTQAKQYLDHLISTNKKIANATHNITSWRIQEESGAVIQDCDDDGESAAGGRLLHLLQLTDSWNVVLVVTRWYGGILLGPDRFRIINTVARDALVKGGFVKEHPSSGAHPKKKGKK
ncbi:MAG: eIF2 kinase Gcn2p negative regulator [Cirrosporium novae-zelandiae]|nr:MAG: eIF2 kinase Gcn2p negative regulator [Cirrosporium novae-zelandiae]